MTIDRLAIILVNYRDYAERYLADCWQSIQDQTWSGSWQVIIVDNESTAASRATIAQLAPTAVLVANEHNDGFAKGNNDGLRRAWQEGYDYALLLNMDVVMEPSALAELVSAASAAPNDWGAIQARLMLHDQPTKINSLGNAWHYLGFGYSAGDRQELSKIATSQVVPIQGYGSGAGLLVRRPIMELVGGFDEVFWMYHDDLELGWRMRLTGHPTYLAVGAVIYHKYQFAKSIKQYYWMERNRWIWWLTAYRWPTILILTPMMILLEAGLWLFALVNGFAAQKAKAVAWVVQPSHWAYLGGRRQQIRRLRRLTDREAISTLVSTIRFQEVDNWLLRWVGNPVMTAYWRLVRILIVW